MTSMTSLIVNCSNEVKSLHFCLQQWLRGEVHQQDQSFSRIANAFAEELILIAPGGTAENKARLQQRLSQSYGSAPGIQIWIENFTSIYESQNFLVVAYNEWRKIAFDRSGRYVTACFRPEVSALNGVVWIRIHETWMASNE